jgi:hypothetical protein
VPSDGFATAQDEAEESKKRLLQGVAEAGTAGRTAYRNAQQAVATQRQSAVQAAAGRAQQVAAPEAYLARQQATISRPLHQIEGSIQAGGAQFDSDIARQSADASTYFDKVKAAVPIVQAQSQTAVQSLLANERQVSADRQAGLTEALQSRMDAERQRQFQAALQKMQREQADVTWQREQERMEFERQMEQFDLEGARLGLDKARTKSSEESDKSPLAQLVSQLGGQTLAKQQLAPIAQQAVQGATTGVGPSGRPYAATTGSGGGIERSYVDHGAVTDGLGAQLGLNPGELGGLLGSLAPGYQKPATAAETAKSSVEAIKATPKFQSESREVANALASKPKGMTEGAYKSLIKQQIRENSDYAKNRAIYEQVIKDFRL